MPGFEDKSPEMQETIERFGIVAFGRSTIEALKNKFCVACGQQAITFKDELSRTEYGISGMCQKCQDEVFE